MPDLTDNQWAIANYIAREIDYCGHQPSYRTIADAMGWTSAAYVSVIVSQLEQKGIVERIGGCRSLLFPNWKHYLKEQRHATHHAAAVDGSRHRDHARRHVRRGARRRGSHHVRARRTPGGGLGRRFVAAASHR